MAALALAQSLMNELAEARDWQLTQVSGSAVSRLAAFLLKLAHEYGRPISEGILIGLPLSQRELGAATGTSREVVARVLRTYRVQGLVATRRRQIVVLRPEALSRLAVLPTS
jgi:CRP-like cAMP-binding protein